MRLDVCHYPREINLSTHLQLLDILGDKLFDVEIVTLLNGVHNSPNQNFDTRLVYNIAWVE